MKRQPSKNSDNFRNFNKDTVSSNSPVKKQIHPVIRFKKATISKNYNQNSLINQVIKEIPEEDIENFKDFSYEISKNSFNDLNLDFSRELHNNSLADTQKDLRKISSIGKISQSDSQTDTSKEIRRNSSKQTIEKREEKKFSSSEKNQEHNKNSADFESSLLEFSLASEKEQSISSESLSSLAEIRRKITSIETTLSKIKESINEDFSASKLKKSRKFSSRKDKEGSYTGELKKNIREGKGKYTWTSGDSYEGTWVDDKQHGQGRLTWVVGNMYTGFFENNEKEGIGEYIWNDGNSYIGEWKNGKMNGTGKFRWNDGREFIGKWENGNRNSIGVMVYRNGNRFEGFFKKGKPNGFGTLTEKSGNVVKGQWKEGKLIKS